MCVLCGAGMLKCVLAHLWTIAGRGAACYPPGLQRISVTHCCWYALKPCLMTNWLRQALEHFSGTEAWWWWAWKPACSCSLDHGVCDECLQAECSSLQIFFMMCVWCSCPAVWGSPPLQLHSCPIHTSQGIWQAGTAGGVVPMGSSIGQHGQQPL